MVVEDGHRGLSGQLSSYECLEGRYGCAKVCFLIMGAGAGPCDGLFRRISRPKLFQAGRSVGVKVGSARLRDGRANSRVVPSCCENSELWRGWVPYAASGYFGKQSEAQFDLRQAQIQTGPRVVAPDSPVKRLDEGD
jgi:hypothetical protein